MDVVADEEDADALGLELLDKLADLRGLGRPQRRGRLVQDEDAGVEMDRPRDRDRLALAAGERGHRLLEAAEIGVEPPHHLARLRFHRGVVERSPARQQFAAEIEVRRRVDIVGERQRLIDRLDAVMLGVARIVDRRFLPVDEDVPGVALVGARQDFDQAGLAGAVVAEQADDFARDRDRSKRRRPPSGRRRRARCPSSRRGGFGLERPWLITPWRFCGDRRCRGRPRRPARRRPPSAERPSRSRAAPCPTAATGSPARR